MSPSALDCERFLAGAKICSSGSRLCWDASVGGFSDKPRFEFLEFSLIR